MQSIAIVGAGIAGLAAARRLSDDGFAVTLFDKSRGVAGRMATRRISDLQFDHGAQYFTARSPRFQAVLRDWQTRGIVAEWEHGRFVGTPGMTAPGRDLARGLDLVASCTVTGLHATPAGWSIQDQDGDLTVPGNGTHAAVILALPSPQAIPIAATAGLADARMDRARYAPCWTLLLAFEEPTGIPDRTRFEAGPLAWIARNGSKPGRAQATETVVVHAAPEWSRNALERSPERIVPLLLEAFRVATGCRAVPLFAQAHRWRYALVEEPAGVPCLWDPERRWGACGDWCLGPRVEYAFESGEAVAEAVAATLRA
jgi:renalase